MGIAEEREAAFGEGFDLARECHNEAMSILHERIAELEAALRRINAINDHPGQFSKEIQDVLDAVIDTSDVKFR